MSSKGGTHNSHKVDAVAIVDSPYHLGEKCHVHWQPPRMHVTRQVTKQYLLRQQPHHPKSLINF
jgi:hypothetical protein